MVAFQAVLETLNTNNELIMTPIQRVETVATVNSETGVKEGQGTAIVFLQGKEKSDWIPTLGVHDGDQ